jgi:acyl-CoA synthetase (AMP-forming)/AMP-acid ligase II
MIGARARAVEVGASGVCLDADGNLWFTDRAKVTVTRSIENICPTAFDAVLMEFQAIDEVAAFVNLEQPGAPQYLGGLGIHDHSTAPGGFVRFKRLPASFERRLLEVPQFCRACIEKSFEEIGQAVVGVAQARAADRVHRQSTG